MKQIPCPRCLGCGHVPIEGLYLEIVEFLANNWNTAGFYSDVWFHEKDLRKRFGAGFNAAVSSLVVAGIVSCKQSAHHGDQFQIDGWWNQAFQEKGLVDD